MEKVMSISVQYFNAKYDIRARVNERKEIAKCVRVCVCDCVLLDWWKINFFELHFAQCDL